jgi:hypothetical protein
VSGHAKENNGDNAYNDHSNNNNKDSEGLIEHYRARRRDQKVEHRRHRGVMQFKVCPNIFFSFFFILPLYSRCILLPYWAFGL